MGCPGGVRCPGGAGCPPAAGDADCGLCTGSPCAGCDSALGACCRLCAAPPGGCARSSADATAASAAAAARDSLLLVDDGWALCEAIGSVSRGLSALRCLLALGHAPGSRCRVLLALPGARACEVAVRLPPPGGAHARYAPPASFLRALLAWASCALSLAPLATGASRGVHGRIALARGGAARQSEEEAEEGAAGANGGGEGAEALYRVVDHRLKVV